MGLSMFDDMLVDENLQQSNKLKAAPENSQGVRKHVDHRF